MGNDLFNGLHTCISNKTYMEKPLCLIAYAKSLRKNNLAWSISAFACGFARLRAPAKHRRNAFAAKVGTALNTKSLHPKKKRCSYGNLRGEKLLNVLPKRWRCCMILIWNSKHNPQIDDFSLLRRFDGNLYLPNIEYPPWNQSFEFRGEGIRRFKTP